MKNKELLLIDGNYLFYKSYYGHKKDTGEFSATYGFARMILYIITKNIDQDIIVLFDSEESKNFRKEDESYKQNRKPMDSKLKEQIPYMKEFLTILNIEQYEDPEWEADDLIASVISQNWDKYSKFNIFTGDKDLFQLVNAKTNVWYSLKGVSKIKIINKQNFQKETGLKNGRQIVEEKILLGDKSDNISGVKGIGEKSSPHILKHYQTVLEAIEDDFKKLNPTQQQKFRKFLTPEIDNISSKKELLEIVRNIPVDIDFKNLKHAYTNKKKVREFGKKIHREKPLMRYVNQMISEKIKLKETREYSPQTKKKW